MSGGDILFDSGTKLAQIKLKLLYILKSINTSIDHVDLTNYVVENNHMDYFTLHELLNDLKKDGFLNIEHILNKECYKLTKLGSESVEMFNDKIPQSFKNEVSNSSKYLRKEIKKKRDLLAHYFDRKDGSFTVVMQAFEKTVTVFNLSVNVPSESLAKKIVTKWGKNPEEIYSEIIKIVMR